MIVQVKKKGASRHSLQGGDEDQDHLAGVLVDGGGFVERDPGGRGADQEPGPTTDAVIGGSERSQQ